MGLRSNFKSIYSILVYSEYTVVKSEPTVVSSFYSKHSVIPHYQYRKMFN